MVLLHTGCGTYDKKYGQYKISWDEKLTSRWVTLKLLVSRIPSNSKIRINEMNSLLIKHNYVQQKMFEVKNATT